MVELAFTPHVPSREILQAHDSNGEMGVCMYLFIHFGFFWTTKLAETKGMSRYTQCIWNICVKRRKTYCNLTIFSSSVRKSFKALDIRESFDKLPYSSWRCGGTGANSDRAFHHRVFSFLQCRSGSPRGKRSRRAPPGAGTSVCLPSAGSEWEPSSYSWGQTQTSPVQSQEEKLHGKCTQG